MHIHVGFTSTVSAVTESLEYFTNYEGILECVVSGGNPKPCVAVYIGINTNNVVALFASHMKVDKKIRGESVGLQHFEYTVTRFINSFRLKPEHDGCVGHGVNDVEQEVEVHVIGRWGWTCFQFQTPGLNI